MKYPSQTLDLLMCIGGRNLVVRQVLEPNTSEVQLSAGWVYPIDQHTAEIINFAL